MCPLCLLEEQTYLYATKQLCGPEHSQWLLLMDSYVNIP